ncbi:MAG: YqjF family protein [Haloplanus sp.]
MPRSLLSMRWEDVCFAHWAVDPGIVAETLPEGLAVDARNGTAYLGIVGFRMRSIRPRGVPVGLSFPELNLRTYVRADDGPGVYFYNLDAADPIGVTLARCLFRLPYYRAEMTVDDRADGTIRFRSRRTHRSAPPAEFDATYRAEGESTPVDPDSLAAFLTERYRFYTESEGGRLYRGTIDHPPWELCDATLSIRENTLFAASGFDRPEGDPLVHYSPGSDVTAGLIRRVDGD